VIVNRIWQHLFERGLVSTVDNFGTTGEKPSHPELLDHLAQRFVREGWSVKKLIRAIVLSHAYQLSAEATPEHLHADPQNRLVWRHSPRRLDAEELRDATLAAAGVLKLEAPVASPAKDFKVTELRNNGPEAKKLDDFGQASVHRSVYLPLLRGIMPRSLEVFDFAEQGMVTGQRETTTVAPQALYLLNDPFVRRSALKLAERLLSTEGLDDVGRAKLAYRLTLGRDPNSAESERARLFVAEITELSKASFQLAAKDTADTINGSGPTPPTETTTTTPANPDDIDRSEAAVKEERIEPKSPAASAWASFCQALLGSAEFRYLP
jgi:hypothetical protein